MHHEVSAHEARVRHRIGSAADCKQRETGALDGAQSEHDLGTTVGVARDRTGQINEAVPGIDAVDFPHDCTGRQCVRSGSQGLDVAVRDDHEPLDCVVRTGFAKRLPCGGDSLGNAAELVERKEACAAQRLDGKRRVKLETVLEARRRAYQLGLKRWRDVFWGFRNVVG